MEKKYINYLFNFPIEIKSKDKKVVKSINVTCKRERE